MSVSSLLLCCWYPVKTFLLPVHLLYLLCMVWNGILKNQNFCLDIHHHSPISDTWQSLLSLDAMLIRYFWPYNLCCLYLFTRFPFVRLQSCLRSLLPIRSPWNYQVLLFHCLACVGFLPSLYRTPYSQYQFISALLFHNMQRNVAFDVYFQVFDTSSKIQLRSTHLHVPNR